MVERDTKVMVFAYFFSLAFVCGTGLSKCSLPFASRMAVTIRTGMRGTILKIRKNILICAVNIFKS